MKNILPILLLICTTTFASTTFAAEKFELTSNLKPGAPISADYYANAFGCTAKSISPALEWKNPPAGTKSYAIGSRP